MIKKQFNFSRKADFTEVQRRVSAWADRKIFGVQYRFDRTTSVLSVGFWTMADGDCGGTARQIESAAASLERILARCAPKEIVIAPPPPPVQPETHLRRALSQLGPVQEFLSYKAGTQLYSVYSNAIWEIRRALDKLSKP